MPLTRRIGLMAIISLGISIVLERFGIPNAEAATSFGIAGLAFSLAAQDTIDSVSQAVSSGFAANEGVIGSLGAALARSAPWLETAKAEAAHC